MVLTRVLPCALILRGGTDIQELLAGLLSIQKASGGPNTHFAPQSLPSRTAGGMVNLIQMGTPNSFTQTLRPLKSGRFRHDARLGRNLVCQKCNQV